MLISAIINKANSGIIIKFEELERTDGYQGITGAFKLKSNGVNDRLFSVYEYEKATMKEIAPANTGF
jgi:DNA topoisomerase VI subunit B